MRYLILFFTLFFLFSCKHEDKKEYLLYSQLNETNELLKKNNAQIHPLVEQIFYKRCKNTNNFRKEVTLLISELDELLYIADNFLKNEKIEEKQLEKFKRNYQEKLNNLHNFSKNIKEWRINSYKIFTTNYFNYTPEHFPEIILKMQNDLLLNKSALFDFILFYSVCQHKPSSFIIPIARDNKLNISSTKHFSFELTCDIPNGKDILHKQITGLKLSKNKKGIVSKPKIQFIYSDTAKVQAIISFENLEKGKYRLEGNYSISRLNENTKDTIKTIMPFEFLFIK